MLVHSSFLTMKWLYLRARNVGFFAIFAAFLSAHVQASCDLVCSIFLAVISIFFLNFEKIVTQKGIRNKKTSVM